MLCKKIHQSVEVDPSAVTLRSHAPFSFPFSSLLVINLMIIDYDSTTTLSILIVIFLRLVVIFFPLGLPDGLV